MSGTDTYYWKFIQESKWESRRGKGIKWGGGRLTQGNSLCEILTQCHSVWEVIPVLPPPILAPLPFPRSQPPSYPHPLSKLFTMYHCYLEGGVLWDF